MKTTYIKCAHGNLLASIIPCKKCEEQKEEFKKLFTSTAKEGIFEKDKRTPIYRGCSNQGGCFCTGRCREIIGYNEPD